MAGLVIDRSEACKAALRATLERWSREPFNGVSDNCALGVLAYVEQVAGRSVDPDPRRLGPVSRATLWANEDAFTQYAGEVMQAFDWPVTLDPKRGDVGLIRRPDCGLTASICVDPGIWAARMARGVAIEPLTHVAAWARPSSGEDA